MLLLLWPAGRRLLKREAARLVVHMPSQQQQQQQHAVDLVRPYDSTGVLFEGSGTSMMKEGCQAGGPHAL
jgi:hypothetical protein